MAKQKATSKKRNVRVDAIDINGLKPKERKEVLETIPALIQEARVKNLPLATKK